MKIKVLLAFAALLASGTANAYPTAAVFTPTGEAHPGGEVGLLAYASTTLSPTIVPGSSWTGAQVGLLPQWEYGSSGLRFGGLEAGFDVISPYGSIVKPVLNAKLGLVTEGDRSPSVAVGLMEASPALPSMNYGYASSTKTFFFGRLTLGLGARTGNPTQLASTFPFEGSRWALMAAYESPLIAKRLGFVLDHLGGSSEIGGTYAGATLLVADKTTLGAGAFLANDRLNAPQDGAYFYLATSFDVRSIVRSK